MGTITVSFEVVNRVEFFSIFLRETSEKNFDLSQQTIVLQPIRSKIEPLAYARFPAPSRQFHVFNTVSYWPILSSSCDWSKVTKHFYKSYEKPPTDAILFLAIQIYLRHEQFRDSKFDRETTSKGPAQLVRTKGIFVHAHKVNFFLNCFTLCEATKALIYYVNLIISSKNNLCYEVCKRFEYSTGPLTSSRQSTVVGQRVWKQQVYGSNTGLNIQRSLTLNRPSLQSPALHFPQTTDD